MVRSARSDRTPLNVPTYVRYISQCATFPWREHPWKEYKKTCLISEAHFCVAKQCLEIGPGSPHAKGSPSCLIRLILCRGRDLPIMRATLPNLIGESFLGQNEGSTWSGLRPRATPVGDPNGLSRRLRGRFEWTTVDLGTDRPRAFGS